MIDLGHGPPLVLVPGIQGRWEWMRPTVEALARRVRVLTCSLPGDRGSGSRIDPKAGFDSYLDQIDRVLDAAVVERATMCGVSYGGLIALHYAARRPARTRALVLVATPEPDWRPDRRVLRYTRAPWLSLPEFVVRSPGRLAPEIRAAYPDRLARLRFWLAHTGRILAAPLSPGLMAERVRLLQGVDFADDCAGVTVPTLIILGEPELDRVVPAASTTRYLALIPGARQVTLERTGHIGLVTRPERFTEIVAAFMDEIADCGIDGLTDSKTRGGNHDCAATIVEPDDGETACSRPSVDPTIRQSAIS